MVHKHLDIQSILEEELKKQRKDRLLHVQQVRHEDHLKRATEEEEVYPGGVFRVSVNEETVPNVDNLGPQQVESLLAFIVEDSMERALENAERDNIVYDGLGEHRILGKKKKKKRPSISYGSQINKIGDELKKQDVENEEQE